MNSHLVPTDQGWPEDKALMADLSGLNSTITRYVLRFLDTDAGRTEPISVEDERALADKLATLAEALQARANRRAALGEQPMTVEGEADTPEE